MKSRGHECQVFSGPQLDYEEKKTIAELLGYVKLPYDTRKGTADGLGFVLYNTIIDGVPAALYETPTTPPVRALTEQQGRAHLILYQTVLDQYRPDVVITYGGQIMAFPAMAAARERGAAVAFWLRNTAYNQKAFFRHANGVLVPSQFSVEFYRNTIDLECTSIPSPVDWARVQCDLVDRKYLTFVNPSPVKGVYVFARVASVLAARRPDIPMLVVESRGKVKWLEQTGIDVSKLTNLVGMTNTRDPKKFLSVTRALIAPSLWQETFGRVTAESMINGIPVLSSNRGGLPEVVGPGGFVFQVPAKYTAETRAVPSEAEIEPVIQMIERLWDDESRYIQACLNARVEAEKWRPDTLGDRYEQYFHELTGRQTR